MKVIVVGATGRCGGHAARAAIRDDRVTKVFVVTRKAVSDDIAKVPKCEIITHKDFTTWPEALMKQLDGAEACLWAVGGRVDQFNHDKVYCRQVNVEFTHAAAKAMKTHLIPSLPAGKKFQFVFCSGALAEWDQSTRLWYLADTRRIKGEIEKLLCDMADADKRLETWILRPTELQDKNTKMVRRWMLSPLGYAIQTEEVGRAMVNIAIAGAPKRILENADIMKEA